MSLNGELIDAAAAALEGCPWVSRGYEFEVARSVVNGLIELATGDEFCIDRRDGSQ